jgi:ribose/xylose/arabinose/galactoside ABC-type transport system permease subunit
MAGLVAAAVSKGGLSNRFTVGEGQDALSYPWYLAALAAIAVGLIAGFVQGTAITRLKVPPFVVTLGGMSVFRGAALLFAGGGPISGFDPGFVWWGQARIGGQVPVPVVIFLVFAILAHIVMGFFCGLGAFVLSARLNSAEAIAGMGYELTVIASVVIGGTSLFGGSGTIFGTVVGTILIGVLLNGLQLNNVSSYVQQIIIGLIIVLAVAFDTFAKSRRRTG